MVAMKESDIRPAGLLAEYLRLSAGDAATFFADRSQLSPRVCPGCDSADVDPAFEKNGFPIVTCCDCGSLYVSPAPTAAALASFYGDSPSATYWAKTFFPAVAEARRGRIFRPRAERVCELLEGASSRVMDVGAGAAVFLEELHRLVPDAALRAVEPGQTLAAACRAKGFETFEGDAENACTDPDWRGWADLVASFEVIEHVPDPAAYLTALAALVRPGGTLLVTGLCGDGFDIQVLGNRSNAVSPPHHLNFLSHKGVAALVARCGLELLDFSTPGQLDVDIVCNALAQDRDAVADPALSRRLAVASEEDKRHMQEQLVAERRSSHMWLIVLRPGAGGD